MNKYVIMCISLFLLFPSVEASEFMAGPAWAWFLLFFIIYAIVSFPGLFFGLFFTVRELLIGGAIVFILNLGILFGVDEGFYGSTVGYPSVFLMVLALTFDSIIGSVIGSKIKGIRNLRAKARIYEGNQMYLVSATGLFIIAYLLLVTIRI